MQIEKFVVPPLGGRCQIRDLPHHAAPPEGGTTNFSATPPEGGTTNFSAAPPEGGSMNFSAAPPEGGTTNFSALLRPLSEA